MEQVKNWAFGICIASVMVSTFNILIPDGKTKKAFDIAVQIVLLSCMILPLTGEDLHISTAVPAPDASAYSQTDRDELVIEKAEEILSSQIKAILKENDLHTDKLSVSLHIGENHCIDYCEVIIGKGEDEDKIKVLLKEMMNVNVHAKD